MKLMELSKASEAKAYFNDLIENRRGIRIKFIFSANPFFSNSDGVRIYNDDTEVYVVFEDDQCLIVDYRFIDGLRVDFRLMNEEEKKLFNQQLIQDYFNSSIDIHAWVKNEDGEMVVGGVDRTETIALDYDILVAIELRAVKEEYSKWIDGSLDFVSPTEETFDQIKFIMSNGNTFTICAANAEEDGYVLTWSEDAKQKTSR